MKNGEFKLHKNNHVVEKRDDQIVEIIKNHKERKEKGGKILDPYKLNNLSNAN